MINKNIPKKHYHKNGLTERPEVSLYDILVVNSLKEILNFNDPNRISDKLTDIIKKIDDHTYSFNSLAENKEARQLITNVLVKTFENGDFNNTKILFEPPFVEFINFFNPGNGLSQHAIHYIIKYIDNTQIDRKNIDFFCNHIKNIIQKCYVSKITKDFNYLQVLVEDKYKNIEMAYPKDIYLKLKDLFDFILKNTNNLDKDSNGSKLQGKTEREIIDFINILLGITEEFKKPSKNHQLLKATIQLFKHESNEEIIQSLSENSEFKEKCNLLLDRFLLQNDIKSIVTILKSPYTQFIDFEDERLIKNVKTHLSKLEKEDPEYLKLIQNKFKL